jgi:hypothetical protein
MSRGKRVTAAALVVLVLGITAGLGPGEHTCLSHASHSCEHDSVSQTSPPASGHRVTAVSEAQHLEQENILCVACRLQAQFSSVALSDAPRVLPPRESTGVGTERDPLPANPLQLHWDARAPPHAAPESSTV